MIIVRQNSVRFLEAFGKMVRKLEPGLHFYLPVYHSVSPVVSLMESVKPIDHQEVITRDNVRIEIDGNFYYRVVDPQKANYEVEDYTLAIRTLSTSVSRAEIGKATLDEIFQHREELNARIKQSLNEATLTWGVECLNYEILKLEPPKDVQKALTEVAMAERTRRQQVIKSEANREYLERKSTAERNAGVVMQEATLEANEIIAEELKKGLNTIRTALAGSQESHKLMRFLVQEEYLAQLEKILANKNVILLPEDKGASGDSLLTINYVLSMLKDPVRIKEFGAILGMAGQAASTPAGGTEIPKKDIDQAATDQEFEEALDQEDIDTQTILRKISGDISGSTPLTR